MANPSMGVNPWTYNGRLFTDPGPYCGFVYLITHQPTGKRYVGRKLFTKSKTRQVKGKKKRSRVSSEWETYWGSSSLLQADLITFGHQYFTRTILHLCMSKSECGYFETMEIFARHALIRPDYYNDWVSCRIRKAHVMKTLHPLLDRLLYPTSILD